MNLAGLSIESIINMSEEELRSLNEKDLRQITSRLISAGNKRLKRAKPTKTGVYSPALISLAEAQGKDLEKGETPHFELPSKADLTKQGIKNTRSAVRSRFEQVKNFLQAKTSTAKGFKEYRSKMYEALGNKITMSKERENDFWRAYNRFMIDDHQKAIFKSKGENAVLYWLRNYAESNNIYDTDSLYQALRKEADRNDKKTQYKFEVEFDDEGIQFDVSDINPQTI